MKLSELPELKGTLKQTAWASKIREDRFYSWKEDPARASITKEEIKRLLSHTAASWWISNRDKTLTEVLSTHNSSQLVSKVKPSSVSSTLRYDNSHDTVIRTETGFIRIGPTRNTETGEIIPDSDESPF